MRWEKPKCALCDSESSNIELIDAGTWMHNEKFKYRRCSKCSLVYLSPRPFQNDIGRYYKPGSYWGVDLSDEEFAEELYRRDDAYGFLYKLIFDKKKKGKVLDIGAGTGLFLTKFKDENWVVDGVDLSKEACNFANNKYRIKIRHGDLLDLKLKPNEYDVITLNGCLEHLHKPKNVLRKTYYLLKKEGLLVITVPNFDSLGRLIFGKKWYALQPPTHLYHFNPKTISTMLIDTGFRIDGVLHSYWKHNYYILFESMRLNYSPNIKSRRDILNKSKTSTSKFTFNPMSEPGKVIAKGLAGILAFTEPYLKRGEVVTVYAKKS